MKTFNSDLTLMGRVKDVSPPEGWFTLACRSGDLIKIFVSGETYYRVLQNLDGLDRDRILDPEGGFDDGLTDPLKKIQKYVWPDGLLVVEGIFYSNDGHERYEARVVHLLHHEKGRYLFEDTHWWLTQIDSLASEWLDDLFGDRRSYALDDFAELYRTNLNIVGLPTDDNIQEMATLARLIYGLASAYMLTGKKRYLEAAKAGVDYQRSTFRQLTHDDKYAFWAHGRRRLKYGSEVVEYSLNPEDYGTYPLYEQIYALAGLAQYYRITNDPDVLADIRRTVAAFDDFYLDDREKNPEFPGAGGYFSHLDYATMRPDHPKLGHNQLRKNWNSIGDHLPAYLINIVLALDPLPRDRPDLREIRKFADRCIEIVEMTSEYIAEKFPDPDPSVPYVRERFVESRQADGSWKSWQVDSQWRWQQDRAVIGHNLKIAWNLTRVVNFFRSRNAKGDDARILKLLAVATRLADAMAKYGLDQHRGGCFDAVERHPPAGLHVQHTWGNTKDFWQQEQGILAYLILHGSLSGDTERSRHYLELARETSAFWNLFFLDHDNRGIFFRTTVDGFPVIRGGYSNKGNHSISGYHAFELSFLAHLYSRQYVDTGKGTDRNFALYFWPHADVGSINVLPDFFPPGTVEIRSVRIGGVRTPHKAKDFQVRLGPHERGREIVVEFGRTGAP